MRGAVVAILALLALALSAASAPAAVPTVGAPSATNIQGVSALLTGVVNPEGLPTSYRFQYVAEADFQESGFGRARTTPLTSAGSSSADQPARVAISGLTPSTAYRFRLLATNGDGSASAESAFATTEGFGFLPGGGGFAVDARADGGAPATMAASHPYQLGFEIGLNQGGEFEGQPGVSFPDGDIRDLRIDMPAGLMVNPAVVARCSPALFQTPRSSPYEESRSGESCPGAAQVGTVEVATSLGGGETRRFGVFNVEPAPGVGAQLGFAPYGAPIVLDIHVREVAPGSYALTLEADDVPQRLDISRIHLVLWGTPWAASHDGERGNCLSELESSFPWAKCSVGPPVSHRPLAYLTMPAGCAGQLAFQARATAWQQAGGVSRQALNRDSEGMPAGIEGCDSEHFQPRPTAELSSKRASSPTGLTVRLGVDHEGLVDPARRAAAPPRKAVIGLPSGVTVNPSVGAGLGACAPDRYAAETAFNPQGAGCPNDSKIGVFRVRSPLFEDAFEGAVYLARPDEPTTTRPGAENPFDSLIAVYLVAKLPQRGVLIRVAGEIVPEPATGTLTATFDDLPQLPYTDLEVSTRPGQRSFLVNPPFCGEATTRFELTSWTGSGRALASSSSPVQSGIDGGPCPSGAAPPFDPGAVAGAVNSNVGSYTPYFIRLSRKDTEQEITSYSLVLPRGITGKLAGIPFCPDAAIAAARSNRGYAETARPSCPAASQVGRTVTGYGIGAALSYAPGQVYLAGPYKGRPLSLVTINAATVGPFDLGTIVIRSAFEVDPRTAQLRIDSSVSDPIPHIIEGVPLRLREVRVHMDRPQFTRNPTSCAASQMLSTLTGSGGRLGDPSDDTSATVSNHFQLLNCLNLGFRPRLGLRLRGGVRRGDYPSLRATFASRGPRDANLKDITVTMPRSLFVAQNHIRGICTRPQFEAERCPRNSIYGRAVAHTPLLDQPLHGPVFLRSSTNPLPDLVASLRSGEVRIILEGRIGPSRRGGVRASFKELPDAAIDRFVMILRGGKRGLLVNSTNICKAPPKASVKALGQNNRGAVFTSRLRGQCKTFRQRKRAAQRRARARSRQPAAKRRGRAKRHAAISAATSTRRRP
ncbi:MAG: fibronectin type III domain-containing protein [Solirubrobacterales bacterium]